MHAADAEPQQPGIDQHYPTRVNVELGQPPTEQDRRPQMDLSWPDDQAAQTAGAILTEHWHQ